MSRVKRSAALTEFETCRLMIRGLEREALANPPRGRDAVRAACELRLRAYRAYGRAATAAASCYREYSAGQRFAAATAAAVDLVVTVMQHELDRTAAGA